jgi:hypothetical protein
MENELHAQVPPVMALSVHLPYEQTVIFDPNQGPEEALLRAEHAKTPLMAYFEANANDLIGYGGQHAWDTLYMEFPEAFVFIDETKSWKPHQQGFTIGRMHFASPSSGEGSTSILCSPSSQGHII